MNFIDTSIIALSLLALFLVIDSLVSASVACWNDIKVKPEQPPQPQPEASKPEVKPEQPITPPVPEVMKVKETAKKKTLAQEVKERCSKYFGYEIKSPSDIKQAFINRTDIGFMQAVNLERKGNDFYKAVSELMDSIEDSKRAKKFELK